jgi:hypothetical protein
MEAEDKHATKRAEILAASLEGSNTPGWGYFGIPGSLAIGDNSYSPKLTKKPAEEGEPLKNVTAAPLKKGAGPDVYFQFMTPVSLGDPYQDPGMINRKGSVKMLDPDSAFKPPGSVKRSINKLGYEYVAHCDTAKDPKEVKEKYKDYMPPRQILTNPGKKGGGGVLTSGVLFGFGEDRRFPEHLPDDYDAAKKMRARELEEHKKKLQEAAFKGNDYGNRVFFNNTETYHYDIPTHVPRDKIPDDASRRYPHEAPFKPSNPPKKGTLAGCLGGFPEYMADPEPPAPTRKPKNDDAPPAFKAANPRQVCNPMPSVVTNLRNMRNERPASFARPVL